MPVLCDFYNCKNRSDKTEGISYFKFPLKDTDLTNQWIVAMKRVKWFPTKHSYLCSAHFEEKYITHNNDCSRLLDKAVPTVFSFAQYVHKTKTVEPYPRKLRKLLCKGMAYDSPDISQITPYSCEDNICIIRKIDQCRNEVGISIVTVEQSSIITAEQSSIITAEHSYCLPSPQKHPCQSSIMMNSSEMEPASLESAAMSALTPTIFPLYNVNPESREDLNQVQLEEDIMGNESNGDCWVDESQGVIKDEIDIEEHSIEEDMTRDEKEGGYWEDKSQAVIKDEIDIEEHSIEEDMTGDEKEGGYWEDKSQAAIKDEIDVAEHSIEEDSEAASEQGLHGSDGAGSSLQDEQRLYRCEVCPIHFSSQAGLNQHMRYHKSFETYKCYLCDKYFDYSSNLTAHLRTNAGRKPYQCNYCDKWYGNISSLEAPYKCKYCYEYFGTYSDFKAHSKKHTRERPYKCVVCDEGFFCRSQLLVHVKTHASKKPIKLKHLYKSFTIRRSLVHCPIQTSGNG